MARKTNDLDKSSKNEIDSKKIHTKLETKKIPASVKTIIKTTLTCLIYNKFISKLCILLWQLENNTAVLSVENIR